MDYIKRKSAIHLAMSFAGRKRNYVVRYLLARRCQISKFGRDAAAIRDYHRNQRMTENEDARLENWIFPEGTCRFRATPVPISRFERLTISG
jgi:putative transposase